MPEFAEAQALLAALAETNEVKPRPSGNNVGRQLHIAYGNALFCGARPLARRRRRKPSPGPAVPASRRCARTVGGRLRSMAFSQGAGRSPDGEGAGGRPSSATSPQDPICPRPASPIAPLGSLAGPPASIARARDHLERALALFEAGRDDDLAFRFGIDRGVGAMGFLAFASWRLGEVDRAISLIDRMQTRMADLTHVGTLAFGRHLAAFFEMMRGDRPRAASDAFELARLARDHGLAMWRAFGVFLEGWTASQSGAPAQGLENMRRGVELLREQNLQFDGLSKIALAEAEARAGDVDRALAVIDEALATCERTGSRV